MDSCIDRHTCIHVRMHTLPYHTYVNVHRLISYIDEYLDDRWTEELKKQTYNQQEKTLLDLAKEWDVNAVWLAASA